MAIPQILQQLQQTPQNQNPQLLSNLKQAAEMYKGIQNPQAFLQNAIMQRNPQVAEVMNYIQQNGGDAQAAFYKYAQEKGINPQEILNMMK